MRRSAIIIFGAALRPDGSPSPILRARVEAALAFGRGLAAPLWLPTGGQGRHGPTEASVMAAILRANGVPASHILEEPTARDTLDSVLACARLLADHAGPVYAASSGFHQPRCLLLLRLVGLDAKLVPPPPAPAGWRRWWWRARELAALPWDVVLAIAARWRARAGR